MRTDSKEERPVFEHVVSQSYLEKLSEVRKQELLEARRDGYWRGRRDAAVVWFFVALLALWAIRSIL